MPATEPTSPTSTPPTQQTVTAPGTPLHTPRVLHVNHFFDGVILALSMIAALLFMRFYRKSRDRFFLYFAASFFIFGINRILFQFYGSASDESKTWLYAIRLVSFALIFIAIVDKNLRRSAGVPPKGTA